MIGTPSPDDRSLEGRRLGGFLLRELFGAGGFGDVYRAEQVGLNREAVVKVLRPDEMTDERVQRFLREAQLASRLDHPYAAHIYAFDAEPDGVLWIAMELVRGSSLRTVLEAQGAMSLDRFVPFFERICEVVHTAHDAGIIHRDLKPDNIMVISRAGRLLPKLLDFGIARATGSEEPLLPAAELGSLERPVDTTTQRGSVLGSPPYMAPELWTDARAAGAASDQYALGALAYEMLTGRQAFVGRTMLEVARAHARGKTPPLGPGFPAELDAVIKRSLARAPADRFANVLELAQALRDASALGTTTIELPQIDEAIRVQFLTGAPQPIADAIAAYDAARNAHQAREALRGLVKIAAWYIGLLALASRTRVGSGGAADSEHVRQLLRDLRRQGLTPAAWISLARHLTQPFVAFPDTHPLPELVLLLHPADGVHAFAGALEGSLSESLADSSEEAASLAIVRELPIVLVVLRAIAFVLTYQLVVPREGGGESWMGARTGAKRTVALQRTLTRDQLVIVNELGGPLLALWPLLQLHIPLPGQVDHLFMLAGPGRHGARLVSTPHNFEHRDDELWDWFRDQVFDQDAATATATAADSPYRGLSSYATSDASWFFGRERETEALINRLKLEPFVAVVGPSGVGKSSFVHAGVAPALASWRVVTSRPGRAPIAQLGAQLAQAGFSSGDGGALGGPDLDITAAAIRRWAATEGGLLVVVDQFEELITLTASPRERADYIALLLAITRHAGDPVRVVITLRDDFLIRADQLPGLDHALARGLQLLAPLTTAALQRILVEPARRAGYEFEDPSLPAQMVADIEGAPAAVALLSFTATRLWELRDRHFLQLPRKAYEALGGVGGALARHADATVDAMPPVERALARRAFRHLVTFDGTRAVLGRSELHHLLGGGGESERLVERLIAARLVAVSDGDAGEPVVEIVHEALLAAWPRLVEWRREDTEGSRFHEQLRAAAKQWSDRARPRGLLWRGDALAEYQLWRKRHAVSLTPAEQAFGDASSADATRGRRIRRALIAIALAVTAIFVVVLWRANTAEQASRRASDRLLRDSTAEQGRLLMLDGDKLDALSQLASAYGMGQTGPAIRFLIEQAARSVRPRRFELVGHAGTIRAVAYAADGRTLATASEDGTARVWDAATGAALATLNNGGSMYGVAIRGDGALAAAGGRPGKVYLWDVRARRELTPLAFAAPYVLSLSFSPDGTRLLASGGGGRVELYAMPSGQSLGTLPGHDGEVQSAFCGDGSCVMTWDRAGKIVVWDAATLQPRVQYQRGDNVLCAAVDRSGGLVAVGTSAGELDLLRPDAAIENKAAHEQQINQVAVSADGTTVATASDDNTARLWDATTGARRAVLAGHRAHVTSVQFAPSSQLVVTTSADRTVRLWSPASGALLGELAGHTNTVDVAALDPAGNRLVSGAQDHRAIVWDLDVARQYVAIETAAVGLGNPRQPIVYSPDSTRIALATPDQALAIIEVATGRRLCRVAVPAPLSALAWSADGRVLATVADDEPVARVWNGACELQRTLAHPHATDVAITDDGHLLTTGRDKAVRLWAADGQLAATFDALPGTGEYVGVVPHSREIYALTQDATAVVLIDLDTRARRVLAAGVRSILTSVAFDAARHRVIASSFDRYLWMWDDRTGAEVGKLEGSGPLFDVELSPDRSTIVSVGGLTPYAWNADTLDRTALLEGRGDRLITGAFLADTLFIGGSRDGFTSVWDLASQKTLDIERAAAAVLSPDHMSVVLAGPDATRLWRPSFAAPDRDALARLRTK